MSDETKIHLDSINEALKMRNTDTTTLKRMPVTTSPSASAVAHKTIKLKPLAPRSNPSETASADSNISTAASKQVPAPSIMLSNKQQIQDQETATPQFMSTTTAAVIKEKKAQDGSQNVSAAKPTINLQDALGHAAPASKISVPSAVPGPNASATQNTVSSSKLGATGTIAIPRISHPPRPVPQPSAVPPEERTVSAAPKYMATATSAIPKPVTTTRTPSATMQYVSTATGRIPGIPKPSPETSGLNTNTQAVSKETIEQAKMQSGLGDSKPAIKLRPSSIPGKIQPSPAAPTIRLAPKTTSSVTPMPRQSPEGEEQNPVPPVNTSASQETVILTPSAETQADSVPNKPDNVTVTTKIPRKSISISRKAPNASTVAPASIPTETAVPLPSPAAPEQQSSPTLRMQNDITNTAINADGIQGSEQEIELDLQKEKTEEPELFAMKETSIVEEDTRKYEPNIIFTIVAVLAFLAIGYVIFVAARQYFSIWG